ncbi:MAG TPA: hypothetical protein VJV05_18230 [Pyrinomonadaceae bacterium]|nr:hypothetical protein [Pyrinomonadaceae bacterium]
MELINRRLFTLLIWMTLLPLATAPVYACTCRFNPNPPCRAADEADVVFDGVVLSVERVESDSGPSLRRRFTLKIKNAYKGSLGKTVTVYTGIGDSDCGYRFRVSKRYLVYAYQSEGRLTTGICTRTRELKNASEDITFLSELPGLPSGVRIFGTVEKSLRRNDKWLSESFQGVAIEIDGAFKKNVVTDANGYFSVGGLPSGSYRVKASPPDGFKLSPSSMVDLFPYALYDEQIGDKGCLEARFIFEAGS